MDTGCFMANFSGCSVCKEITELESREREEQVDEEDGSELIKYDREFLESCCSY
jgi:hypothetical protein